ncbi:hypothetical protein NX059_000637 [Plenodomus lindquistii]|nr:hypothetical protein NX059_000637 [Plenodomus lindquistii]
MHSQFPLLAASIWCLFFSGSISSPTPVQRPKALRVRQESSEPQSTACGDVIDIVNDGYAYFYASDAYDCLTSVPFNAAVAQRFINYVNDTLQFQSTLAYLKDPQTGYQQPAVDVQAQLQSIKNKVTTAGITAAFSFLAPFSITVASADGTTLPELYVTTDVVKARDQGWTPSPIPTINNQSAVEYLTRVASLNSFGGIEAHADWNQLFHTPALDIRGNHSIWDGYINFYPGDEIDVTVANGTNYTDYWLTPYNEPFDTGPLATGGGFYNYFVMGLLPASYNTSGDLYNPAYAPTTPIGDDAVLDLATNSWREDSNGADSDPDVFQYGLAATSSGIVSGYYLHDVDATVLSLPSFAQNGYAIQNFSIAVSNFISNVTTQGLTRVVIDLQQNAGGTIELAFSTFKRFFPDNVPFSGSRRRNHRLGNILGKAYTAFFDSIEPGDPRYYNFVADEWVVTSRLNAGTDQNFTSWVEFAEPIQERNNFFSLTMSSRNLLEVSAY